MPSVTILDGPMGTELARLGVDLAGPSWTARAVEDAPETISRIHAEYARAGATVHTTATFRTQPHLIPGRWESLARRAVEIARASVPRDHTVAGGLAPLADCYRPDLSPASHDPGSTRNAHAALARVLVEAGCDLLLCESFSHIGEGLLAAEAALNAGAEAGIPVWLSFTPGYRATLLSEANAASGAVRAADLGVSAVLVNCVPLERAEGFVRAMSAAVRGRGVQIGVYANAGQTSGRWRRSPGDDAAYLSAAGRWAGAGASLIGACCGGTPALIRSLTEGLTTRTR